MSFDSMPSQRRAEHTRLDPQQREVLARLFAHRRYPKNAVVLHRGVRSNVMFMVCRGTIQLSTEHEWASRP